MSDFKLPNRIIDIPNPDKLFHEKWFKNRNMLNIPHPFRCVLLGPPNTGKTLMVKNLLLRANPPFKKVYIIHCDPDFTQEYDDIEGEFLKFIPSPQEWEGKEKTMIILDDLEFNFMPKDQKRNLDRLFGNVSTHKNISVCLCSQDPFSVPNIVRKCSNLWILWKVSDLDELGVVARRTGFKSSSFKSLFKDIITGPHDSLWIDKTKDSPFPLRKNGFENIIVSEDF